MKKTILTLLSFGFLLNGFSQISCTSASDYFYEKNEITLKTTQKDFVDPNKNALAGIFWSQDTLETTNFSSKHERNGDGKLIYTLYQPEKEYNPIYVSFGTYMSIDETEQPFLLNLINSAELSFRLINLSSDTIEVKVALQDVNNHVLGYSSKMLVAAYGQNDLDHLYKYEIGATGEGKFGPSMTQNRVNEKDTLNFYFNFKDAIVAEYVNNPKSEFNCDNLPQFPINCTDGSCFDFTQVKGVSITVLNTKVLESNCYTKKQFSGKVVLEKFYLGYERVTQKLSNETSFICVTGLTDFNINEQLEVFPNPSKNGLFYMNENIEWEVYSLLGVKIKSNKGIEIDLTDQEKGIYLIKTKNGFAKVIFE